MANVEQPESAGQPGLNTEPAETPREAWEAPAMTTVSVTESTRQIGPTYNDMGGFSES